jgi:hypothetical protein
MIGLFAKTHIKSTNLLFPIIKLFLAFLVGIEKLIGDVLRQAAVSKVGAIFVKRSGNDEISVSASLAQICRLTKSKDPRLLATIPKTMVKKILKIFSYQLTFDTQFMARDIRTMLVNVVMIGNSSRKVCFENDTRPQNQFSSLKKNDDEWPNQKFLCFCLGQSSE